MNAQPNARWTARSNIDGVNVVSARLPEFLGRRLILELQEQRQVVHTSSSQVYERKTPSQGTSPGSIRSLNRHSNAGYPANIPHRVERGECAKGRARGGWMRSPTRCGPR